MVRILVAQSQLHHLLISVLKKGVKLGVRLMFANFLFYQRGEVWCLCKLRSWQWDHNCVEFVDQKLFVEWTSIQTLNKGLTLQKCRLLALRHIDRLLIMYLLSWFSCFGLNFLSAILVYTLNLLFRHRDGTLQVLPLLLRSKALFLKLHIDSRHFAVCFLLLPVL